MSKILTEDNDGIGNLTNAHKIQEKKPITIYNANKNDFTQKVYFVWTTTKIIFKFSHKTLL